MWLEHCRGLVVAYLCRTWRASCMPDNKQGEEAGKLINSLPYSAKHEVLRDRANEGMEKHGDRGRFLIIKYLCRSIHLFLLIPQEKQQAQENIRDDYSGYHYWLLFCFCSYRLKKAKRVRPMLLLEPIQHPTSQHRCSWRYICDSAGMAQEHGAGSTQV